MKSKHSSAERAEAWLLLVKTKEALRGDPRLWEKLKPKGRRGLSRFESWIIEAMPDEITSELLALREPGKKP